ncbi:hypothetical protein AGRA3207_004525 [Actinomadura graeca]|uniref:Uncharacterized protein n=1 Tax=Actinomadura graeca TaxID=2750812 RepID=A0ABX8QYG3_9ACTN|nr:hypothetical protein [Actinomadura graeca]QXJ23381.1 hypothetical protein AGRA3207_004525 [Actinomadura graeca]
MSGWFPRLRDRGADDAPPPAQPRHHLLCGVDISGYSRHDQKTQMFLRHSMYKIIKDARRAARIPPWRCQSGDRGDGILIVADSGIGPEMMFPAFVERAKKGVRDHNACAARDERERMRLRMAVHAGYLQKDSRGFSGDAANHVARLLDAPALKGRMDEWRADFAVVVSEALYREVSGYHLIDPGAAFPIPVDVKETHGRAWAIIL